MGAAWLNLIPQLPDFAGAGMNYGVGRLAAGDYEAQVRDLRRTAYQDMVFSLKKAGLNPMLAVGAHPGAVPGYAYRPTPGGGNAGIGGTTAQLSSAKASQDQAGTAQQRADQDAPVASGKAVHEQASAAQAEAQTGVLVGQLEKLGAEIALLRAQTLESGARATNVATQTQKTEAEMPASKAHEGFGSSTTGMIRQFISELPEGKVRVAEGAEKLWEMLSSSAKEFSQSETAQAVKDRAEYLRKSWEADRGKYREGYNYDERGGAK